MRQYHIELAGEPTQYLYKTSSTSYIDVGTDVIRTFRVYRGINRICVYSLEKKDSSEIQAIIPLMELVRFTHNGYTLWRGKPAKKNDSRFIFDIHGQFVADEVRSKNKWKIIPFPSTIHIFE